MHALWHWILYLLACMSHEPASIARERAAATGYATVAYATLATEPAPPQPQKQTPACAECKGTGRIYRTDGGYVRCPCGACHTGKCPPGAALAPARSTKPAGEGSR